MANKIITVTANTAIDNHIVVEKLSVGTNMAAGSSREFAAGKGVNVSKAVEALGCPVIALGFVGRRSLDRFSELRSRLLKTDFVSVEGKTRTNITLIELTTRSETHIRTPGYTVSIPDCEKLLGSLLTHVAAGDIVVLSGSLPAGAPADFYKSVIEVCHEKSAISILDACGEFLIHGLQAKPFLIKPNQQEFEQLTGRNFSDEYEIVDAAREFIEDGVEWVVISRGSKGALYVDQTSAVIAKMSGSLPGIPVSSIGCGDSMVAGLAVSKLRRSGLHESIKLSMACGVASLFSDEPGRFDSNQLLLFEDRIILQTL